VSGIGGLVLTGPLLLALPVAVAAGAATFLSPCVLPLVPGYLSYLTGMSGSAADRADGAGPGHQGASVPPGAQRPSGGTPGEVTEGQDPARLRAPAATAPDGPAAVSRSAVAVGSDPAAPGPGAPAAGSAATRPGQAGRARPVAGTALFVLGFSALFAIYGTAFGGLGAVLHAHQQGLTRVLGVLVIVLGLLFAGAFDRFGIAGRTLKPSVRPRAGLAGAPLLGVLFGLGWIPCVGPTLGAVLTLGLSAGTAARGALLAFAYALGLGIPFLLVALAFDRGMRLLRVARVHGRLITRIGGLMLVTVGLLEVTGAWTAALIWLQVHLTAGFTSPL
jgi:cytochrome c-type biogenesis protein